MAISGEIVLFVACYGFIVVVGLFGARGCIIFTLPYDCLTLGFLGRMRLKMLYAKIIGELLRKL